MVWLIKKRKKTKLLQRQKKRSFGRRIYSVVIVLSQYYSTQHFYYNPNTNSAVFGYQKSPVRINILNMILPDMLCGQAGLNRKTSHCLRVTCATQLFQHSVDEKLIWEQTGHRSNALFNYERNSVEHGSNFRSTRHQGKL